MPWDAVLLVVMVGIFIAAAFAIATNKMTPEERDEMLNRKDMWP